MTVDMDAQIHVWKIFAWLGVQRDKMPPELVADLQNLLEAAQQGVQPTPPTACEFCGHVPAKSNDGLRNPANTAGG